MGDPASRESDLRGLAAATRCLLEGLDGLDEAAARAPSRLPDWSRGHVLTHLARNADSHVRRCRAAARGEQVEQYPGGPAGRAAEIAAGAGRPASVLVEDVRSSAAALDRAWAAVPAAAWEHVSADVGGTQRPLHTLPLRRWQEVEIHHADLGLDFGWADWSSEFVERFLPVARAGVARRVPAGGPPPPAGAGLSPHEELAWMTGRWQRPDLPELGPWG